MNILNLLFKKKAAPQPPEEELRLIDFKLREYDVPDRKKLQKRRDELLALIEQQDQKKPS